MGEEELAPLPFAEEDGALLFVAALCLIGGLVLVFHRCNQQKPFQQTVQECEENTPLVHNEGQAYINKVRKDMAASGIQLGGEFEYRLAQAHLKAKRKKEADAGGVRQRLPRDARVH